MIIIVAPHDQICTCMYKTTKIDGIDTGCHFKFIINIQSRFIAFRIRIHRCFALSMEDMSSQPSHGGHVEQDSRVLTDLLNMVGLKGNGHLAFESPVERLMDASPSVRYPS